MDRRSLLKLMGAAALAQFTPVRADASGLKVVVVGAGIVGASIGWHLSRYGAQVTVLDAVAPASQCTGGTFAWINATWAKQPRAYHQLNQDSVAAWAPMAKALGLTLTQGGSIEWFDDPERMRKLDRQIAEQQAWGEPAQMLSREELERLAPGVQFGTADRAAFSPNDGAVDAPAATRALLQQIEAAGGRVRFPVQALDIRTAGDRLLSVITDQGEIAADRLVVATGADADAPKRLAGIDIPQRSTPGIIVTTTAMPRIMQQIVVAPGIHVYQHPDGRVVMGEQEGPPSGDAHALRLADRPNTFPSTELAQQHAERIRAVGAAFVPTLAKADIDTVRIGWRPLPLDGHPVLGRSPHLPDVSLAVMHSGVSLAPVVGQLISQEIASGERLPELADWRPDREFQRIKRY